MVFDRVKFANRSSFDDSSGANV